MAPALSQARPQKRTVGRRGWRRPRTMRACGCSGESGQADAWSGWRCSSWWRRRWRRSRRWRARGRRGSPGALRCAIFRDCGEAGALRAAYGPEVGELVRGQAPSVVYERGTFRCPSTFAAAARTAARRAADRPGAVARSARGRVPASAFTRVVDRRDRGGDLFLQFWLYYPDSTYVSQPPREGARPRGRGRLSPRRLGGYRCASPRPAAPARAHPPTRATRVAALGWTRARPRCCRSSCATPWTTATPGSPPPAGRASRAAATRATSSAGRATTLHARGGPAPVPIEPLSRGPCRWRGSESRPPGASRSTATRSRDRHVSAGRRLPLRGRTATAGIEGSGVGIPLRRHVSLNYSVKRHVRAAATLTGRR